MPLCRSCGMPVIWITLQPSGKRTPVDAIPVGGEDHRILVDLGAKTGVILSPMKRRESTEPLYRSHFVTCEQADDWRKKRDDVRGIPGPSAQP